MILATLCLAVAAPVADGSELISKMFAYYFDAKSMSGKIKMTQVFENRTATIDTQFQFEWPAKIYIKQGMSSPTGADRWLVTGDGEGFTYDAPRIVTDRRQDNRLYEPVQFIPPPPKYKTDPILPKPPPHDVRSIYRAVCLTIGDRSLPIDVAFGRKEDLAYIKGQLATVNLKGDQEMNGAKCHVVGGKWKDKPGDTIYNGEYELYITDSGELKRFARAEDVSIQTNQGSAQGKVVTVWDVNITKNGGLDPSLFKLVLKY